MKFTKEQEAAIIKALADKKLDGMESIRGNVGDSFNSENLANAVARVEYESLISPSVVKAQRYAKLIPVDTTTGGVKGTALVKRFEDAIGIGKPSAGTGTGAPLADVIYGEQKITIDEGDVLYKYSVSEMRAASASNTPLLASKALAARLAYEKHIYKVAMMGEPETGKFGLLNHTIPEVAAATESWTTGNVDNIMGDLARAIAVAIGESDISGDTSLLPDTILLPMDVMMKLASIRIGTNSEKTLLAFIRENNLLTEIGVPNVKIESLPELNTAGADSTRRVVVYRRDPSALELILPSDLEFLAPQAKGLDVLTYGTYLYAGLWIKDKNAVVYLDGV